jgi:Methyltransferase small domain
MIVGYSLYLRISPMPTGRKVKEALLNQLPEFEGKIMELGAGFGTLAIPLAKKFPQKVVEAYELSPIPYFYILLLKNLFSLPNLKVMRRDFFKASLQEGGLIVCYLYPGAMRRLEKKFTLELPKGSIVISHTFALYDRNPCKTLIVKDLYNTKIYLYKSFIDNR